MSPFIICVRTSSTCTCTHVYTYVCRYLDNYPFTLIYMETHAHVYPHGTDRCSIIYSCATDALNAASFWAPKVQRHPVLVPSFQRLDEEEQNLIVYCLKVVRLRWSCWSMLGFWCIISRHESRETAMTSDGIPTHLMTMSMATMTDHNWVW